MKPVKLLAIILFIIALQPSATAISVGQSSYDGAPMTLLLIQALNNLYSMNYQQTINLTETALTANIPDNLEYLHMKTWSIIANYSKTSLQAKQKGHADISQLYTLYRDKIELEETLPQYASQLLSQVKNTALHNTLSKTLKLYISNLGPELDKQIKILAKAATGGQAGATIEAPSTVYAGENITITILFTNEINITKTRILVLTANPIYNHTINPIGAKRNLTLEIPIPGADEAPYTLGDNQGKILAVITGTINNESINIITSKPLTIKTLRPTIYFQTPRTIKPGENITLQAISTCDTSLETNITITKPHNNTVLYTRKITINPGKTNTTLATSTLEPGIYTMEITVNPRGKYIGITYSKAIAVEAPEVVAKAPKLVIGPPFTTQIEVSVKGSIPNTSILIVKGETYTNQTTVHATGNIIQVQLGWPIIQATRHLEVQYISPDDHKVLAEGEISIYTVNMLSIIILAIILTSISTASSRGLKITLNKLSNTITKASRTAAAYTPVTFTSLYHKFIQQASNITPPPKPSETLREYYERLASNLKQQSRTTLRLTWEFIKHYEQYLYSRRKPLLAEFKRLYNRITSLLR